MDELAADMPEGLGYAYANDSTNFIKLSVSEVQKALFEAILLVVVVMFVFLQSWRATLIPAIAVPVVLLGTFAVFRSEEHTSELQSLMRISYAVFCLKNKITHNKS